MSEPNVVAVLVADIHLSARPPTFRSVEPDWYVAMARPLQKVAELCRSFESPLIIAGDIFDRWNSPPQLINFAIEQFRSMETDIYTIPGQHDLPYHDLGQTYKSAYGTLIRSKVITDLSDQAYLHGDVLYLAGFPWGAGDRKIRPYRQDSALNVAVVHRYCWMERSNPAKSTHVPNRADCLQRKLYGFDVVVVGDNHQGFTLRSAPESKLPVIWNCGTLMRRKSDEFTYNPRAGLLCEDGSVHDRSLVSADDVFAQEHEVELLVDDTDLKRVIEQIRELGPDSLDFRHVVDKLMMEARVGRAVKQILWECINEP